jgi:hypothetical protein
MKRKDRGVCSGHQFASCMSFFLIHCALQKLLTRSQNNDETSLGMARKAHHSASICDSHWFLVWEPSEALMDASLGAMNTHWTKNKQDIIIYFS